MTRLDIGSGGQSTLSDVSVPAANRRLDISALAANKLVYTYWHQWPSEPSRRFQPPKLHRHAATKLALMLYPYRNQAVPSLPRSLVVQSGSSQPPMLFSCTIRQFPTFHVLNVQSYNQAIPDLCSQCTVCSYVPNVHNPLSPMWNTYMSFKYPPLSCTPGCASIYDYPRQVSATPLWNWELLQVAKHLRKRQKSAKCPCTKMST